MKIKKSTLNQILNISVLLLVLGTVTVFALVPGKKTTEAASTSNVTQDLASGKQIVQINAKVGYTPSISEAKANTPTTLRINTKNTFDCSTALTIPKLGVNINLPFNGSTDIDIPPQAAGAVINATCSMGMYSFQIKFV